jgi:hypothetical protein
VHELAPRYLERQGCWILSPLDHQVVEWLVLPEKDGVLGRGRLYHVPRDLRDGELYERSATFLEFALTVRRLAERLAPIMALAEGGRARVGPSARRRYETGELRFV